MPRCLHIIETGWQEFECALTGASMDADCGALSASPCLPRQALMLMAGTLDAGALTRSELAELRRIAELITERRQTMGEERRVVDVNELTQAELEAVIEKAKQRKRAITRAQRDLPKYRKRRGVLKDQATAIIDELSVLDKAIVALEEGKVPGQIPALKGTGGRRTPAQEAALANAREKAAEARRTGKKRVVSEETRQRMRDGAKRRHERERVEAKQPGRS